MELSRVGSDLLGPTESQVLTALARLTDPVSGRQLTKLAGAESNSTVQRYLAKLKRIGLVFATETPSATLYRLNRTHVFWDAIQAILAAPAAIEQEIATLVARELGAAARVAVFGSVAAGTAGPDSDYDLLLIVDNSISPEARSAVVSTLTDVVEKLTGNACQVVDISEHELSNLVAHDSSIVRDWSQNARPIDGRGQIPHLHGLG